jgi:hypothetical protein
MTKRENMEIIHHIGFNSNSKKELCKKILNLGLKIEVHDLPGNSGSIVTFDISESDPDWNIVYKYLKDYIGLDIYHGGDMYDTYFSDQEIRKADWLRLIPTYFEGYSRPKGSWPFNSSSLTNVCTTCGIYNQPNPMWLYKEPGLRKNSFMRSYNSSELFAIKQVFSELRLVGARGYEIRNVLINKTREPSEKILQLYIPFLTNSGLLEEETMRKVTCHECGVTKYFVHKKGIMRFTRDAVVPDVDFMQTFEWFGGGLHSFREIIVSNRIAQLILDKNWKGVRFKIVRFE